MFLISLSKTIKSKPIYGFALRGLTVYILWFILYDLWLLPDGRLDEYVSLNIISVSAGLLETFGFDSYTAFRVIGIGNSPGVEIVNGCNGLAAIGLFMGFIIAYPGDSIKRYIILFTGVGIIYLINIIRIIALALTQVYWVDLFNFTHDYSTTTIFYFIIFILWIIWANYGDSEELMDIKKAES